MKINIYDSDALSNIGKKAVCSKGTVATITGIGAFPWGTAFTGITCEGVAWCSQNPTILSGSVDPHQRKVIEAAAALYYAGCWRCDRPADEAKLWEALRDACGFTPGEAPMPTVNGGL